MLVVPSIPSGDFLFKLNAEYLAIAIQQSGRVLPQMQTGSNMVVTSFQERVNFLKMRGIVSYRLNIFFPVLLRAMVLILLLFLPALHLSLFAQEAEVTAEPQFWFWSFLGRFHPMIVHFPVSLIFIALFMEIIAGFKKTSNFKSAIRLKKLTQEIIK